MEIFSREAPLYEVLVIISTVYMVIFIRLSVQLHVHSTMISTITVETTNFVVLAVTAGMLHDVNDSIGVAAGQEGS